MVVEASQTVKLRKWYDRIDRIVQQSNFQNKQEREERGFPLLLLYLSLFLICFSFLFDLQTATTTTSKTQLELVHKLVLLSLLSFRAISEVRHIIPSPLPSSEIASFPPFPIPLFLFSFISPFDPFRFQVSSFYLSLSLAWHFPFS